jgi:hypothetical protein
MPSDTSMLPANHRKAVAQAEASGISSEATKTNFPQRSSKDTPNPHPIKEHKPATATTNKVLNQRPNRTAFRASNDPKPTTSYGTPISIKKQDNQLRIFYQNIKGLSHVNSSNEDYDYYLHHLRDLTVDLAGLSETNTAWQHNFLRHDFSSRARKAGDGLAKTSFGSPNIEIDRIPPNEIFQAGGSITLCLGLWTTAVFGSDIQDQTGLGRWSGMSLRGKHGNILSVITAYRTCAGSRQSASLGSTFHREADYFKWRTEGGCNPPNPRQMFLNDMKSQLHELQDAGHYVILMLDANATLQDDDQLRNMVEQCGLHDLHKNDPAPSTYIGAVARRIDYMFGCRKIIDTMTRHGTLAYDEGPQSDHRALYVDLDIKELLHHHVKDNAIQPPQARTLKIGNPESVALYLSKMHEYYDRHNMIKRINRLHRKRNNYTKEDLQTRMERWDRDQGRAMKFAEKALGSTR